ncbi:MAG: transposase zinc-binding domain-containing protein [bacterium]
MDIERVNSDVDTFLLLFGTLLRTNNMDRVYHPRESEASPLWRLFNNHFEDFEECYEERFEREYGFLRPVICEVVYEYLRCGDLREGFARVRCQDCNDEYLLAFSCKGRWFCPSCHSKKVIQFGENLRDNLLYPIPHRQYVFSIPIMLRIYFKYDRALLTRLCHSAYESLLLFLTKTIGLKDGVPGVVMTIHTFGDYADKFHPHIHALVSDGLFAKNGTFYVMPKVDLKPLEDIFRAKVFKMLKDEGKINDYLINRLMKWRHSGFSVDNGVGLQGMTKRAERP